MVVYSVEGKWNGIYEWGKGFVSSEVYEKWQNFWHNEMKCIHWQIHKARESYSSDYLIGMNGSIYLHPMSFDTVLYDTESVRSGTVIDGVTHWETEPSFLKDLYKVCTKAAEACGGTFKMYVKGTPLNDGGKVAYSVKD